MPHKPAAHLLYITSEDWFFESHFAHVAQAAQQNGFLVSVACQGSKMSPLASYGFTLYPQKFERGKRSFLHAVQALPRLIATLRKARPDIVHIIGLQNILFAAPAAAFYSRGKLVLAPIGLGRFWVEDGLLAKFARLLVRIFLHFFHGARFFYLFENGEDAAELGLKNYPRLKIVGGAGVDETKFAPQAFPPAPPVCVAVVSRMLRSKGIMQAIQVVRRARSMGYDIVLNLWGAPDPANASSLSESDLCSLSKDGVTWHGATNEVQNIWKNTHIAMLLSVREGLPKSLLEAAACGRPIIANDVPGCRALLRNGQEGFLVAPNDADGAMRALVKLAGNPALREKLGAAARARILHGFTQKQVAGDILNFYAAALS
jgi:glycosyltransferase involved in cell wall biosynthesis